MRGTSGLDGAAARSPGRVAAEINRAGGKAVALRLDVTDADQLTKVVAEVERQLSSITILMNNAGIRDAQHAAKMSMD
ncbi:SDR family NAD(P)-dependent oxidoreductase [Bradyrhizobium sp. CCBAU 45384]|uniref:SDR family NAD(P)-dependent oxidoreductase n=1 Tax=Bradyrhizobium sp. CCBAU 45384 TaxID=858428 RepID=UPI00230568ED|nr:SDR family NAD(P)-dependent oxidoreductase [Bradyrhizobium sp. CCBAU 45384]